MVSQIAFDQELDLNKLELPEVQIWLGWTIFEHDVGWWLMLYFPQRILEYLGGLNELEDCRMLG